MDRAQDLRLEIWAPLGTSDDAGRPVYLVTHWALTKELRTLDNAETWLTRATGVRHG